MEYPDGDENYRGEFTDLSDALTDYSSDGDWNDGYVPVNDGLRDENISSAPLNPNLDDQCAEKGSMSENEESGDDNSMDNYSSDGINSMCDEGEVHYLDVADKMCDLSEQDVCSMTFGTVEEAEVFYNLYSKAMGFSVRREDVKRSRKDNKVIVFRLFVCNREGYRRMNRDKETMQSSARKYELRPVWKVGCGARFSVRFHEESGRFVVSSFVKDHNHELVPHDAVHFERSHRKISDIDAAQINSMRFSGIPTRLIVDYMVRSAGGHSNLGFTEKDIYNFIYRAQLKERAEGDANVVLAYLNGKKQADPNFFFKFTVDGENRLNRLFWSDSQSRVDYNIFGDVLVFDSTYKNNVYHKPLVVMAGVNNHYLTCIFASAVIADERDGTYEWVLETFVECMMHKFPKTVMTDGDFAMANAISRVMPNAVHRLCNWHLKRNALQNVHVEGFLRAFRNLMRMKCSVDEFEDEWRRILTEFGLVENSWMAELYSKRHKWAEAYLAGHFFAGMRSTQRCEKMNSYLNKYLKSRHRLYQFMLQFEIAITKLRDKEICADRISKYSEVILTTKLTLLEAHAAKMFTRRIFYKVREEILNVATLVIVTVQAIGDGKMYSMCPTRKPDHIYVVEIGDGMEFVTCSCGKFESHGIPCRHIINVLVAEHIDKIPECLLLNRWMKEAKSARLRMNSSNTVAASIARNARIGALNAAFKGRCREGARTLRSYRSTRQFFAITSDHNISTACESGADSDHEEGEDDELIFDEQWNGIRDPPMPSPRGRYRASGRTRRGRRACGLCRNYGHNRTTCYLRQQTRLDELHENTDNTQQTRISDASHANFTNQGRSFRSVRQSSLSRDHENSAFTASEDVEGGFQMPSQRSYVSGNWWDRHH